MGTTVTNWALETNDKHKHATLMSCKVNSSSYREKCGT